MDAVINLAQVGALALFAYSMVKGPTWYRWFGLTLVGAIALVVVIVVVLAYAL